MIIKDHERIFEELKGKEYPYFWKLKKKIPFCLMKEINSEK